MMKEGSGHHDQRNGHRFTNIHPIEGSKGVSVHVTSTSRGVNIHLHSSSFLNYDKWLI